MPVDVTVLQAHYDELVNTYPRLILIQITAQEWLVKGLLKFRATYDKTTIEDEFQIEIIIPDTYPDKPPMLKETGNKIPDTFHRNGDNTKCLGVPLEIRMKFKDNPTLIGFVEELVVPYLFSYSYWDKHNKMPFDEWSHFGRGILEYYQDLLNVRSEMVVLEFLKILADDNYRGHINCPCGSGEKLRKCHGEQIRNIQKYMTPNDFYYDYAHVISQLDKKSKEIPKNVISKKLIKNLKHSKRQ